MAASSGDHSTGESPVDRYKLLLRLQILAGFGCVLIGFYAWRFRDTGDSFRIAGVALLVAGAALLSGFLLGFIFGIPRVGNERAVEAVATASDGAQASIAEDQSNKVRPNSNLVEISDWLTKILVGVGLVELNSIPDRLGKLAYDLGPGLRPSQCGTSASCSDFIISGQAAGLAIIVFYFTLGFLFGYVWTRLYFQRDLGGLVKNLQRHKEVTDLIMQAEASVSEGQLGAALSAINGALKKNPSDGRAVLTKARILKRQATPKGQPLNEKLLNQALALADQAITLLPDKAEPIYNKACYQALLGVSKNEVLANLKSAFHLNPALRKMAGTDNDLMSLWQDVDFISLTGSAPSANA